MLSDLYFVDPQWLCSMLANVITVQAKNPFQKNGTFFTCNVTQLTIIVLSSLLSWTLSSGFMMVDSLKQIFRHGDSDFSLIAEFTTLMQRFEVVLLLDEHRLLIPSLLPPGEVDSCVVFPKTVTLDEAEAGSFEHVRKEPTAPILQTPYPLFVRYYLLPFVPNGFFPRLIARIMGSDVIEHVLNSLSVSPMEEHYFLNTVHWQCWRNGIVLIWKRMEILRITHLSWQSTGISSAQVISNSGESAVETLKGVEITVATLPKDMVSNFSMMKNPTGVEQVPQVSQCLATWLLHQATTIVDSVFDDWYEGFARKKGFELSTLQVTNPCPECFSEVRQLQNLAATPPLVRRLSLNLSHAARNIPGLTRRSETVTTSNNKPFYVFSTPYCAYVLAEGKKLACPNHGAVKMEDVAPDLVS